MCPTGNGLLCLKLITVSSGSLPYSMPYQQSHSLDHLAVFAVRVCRLCLNLFPDKVWVPPLDLSSASAEPSYNRSCQVTQGHCFFWGRFCLVVLVSGCILPKTDNSGPCPTPTRTPTCSHPVGSGHLCAPYHLWSPDPQLFLGIV